MKMAVSLCAWQCGGITVRQSIDRAVDLGFTMGDVLSYGDIYPSWEPMSEQRQIVKRLEQTGFQINAGINLPKANPGSDDVEERKAAAEEVINVAKWIKRLGGKAIMFCEAGGRPHYEHNLDGKQAFQNATDTVKRVADWCLKENMLVLLETIPYGGTLNTVEQMVELAKNSQAPNVYCNADFGHLCLQKINPQRLLNFGDRLICCHASDNTNYGDEGHDAEHDLLLGSGATDFAEYFNYCFKDGIDENAKKAGFNDESYCLIEVGECTEAGFNPNPDWQVMRCRDFLWRHFPWFRDCALK